MNRILPILLVVLLAVVGVVFLMNDSSSADDGTSSADSSATLTDDQAGNGGSAAEGTEGADPDDAAITRAELEAGSSSNGYAAEQAPSRIDLQLVDSDGNPIEGATLAATERPDDSMRFQIEVRGSSEDGFEASAVTDEDGRVSLEVPAGTSLQLEARGEFWAPIKHDLAALTPSEVIDLGKLTLTVGDNLVGRVLDPSGKPFAGASIGLEESGSSLMRGSSVHRKAVSDENGYFRIGGLPTGKYRVLARAAGFAAAELDPLIIPGTGRDVEVSLAMSEGRVVRGTIVDLDGKPIVGASVSPQMRFDSLGISFGPPDDENDGANQPTRRDSSAALTDSQGNFSLGGLDEQDSTLTVRADGYSTTRAMIPAVGEDVLVRLHPRLSLSGTLLLPNGNPAANLDISVTASLEDDEEFNFNRFGVPESTITDADGNFEFKNLSAGAYTLSSYSSTAQVDAMPVRVFENINGLTVEMVAAQHLMVNVRSAAGDPIPEAKVKVTRQRGGSQFARMSMDMDEHGSSSERIIGPDIAIRAESDAEGIALVPGVDEGERFISVEADGYADAEADFVRNSGTQELEMVLQPASGLRAVVKTASGRHLSGVEVYLKPQFEDSQELSQKSGVAGRVVWDDLRPGPYELGYREAGGEMMGMVFIGNDAEEGSNDSNHKVSVVELVGRSTLDTEIIVDDMALPTVEVSRNGSPAGGVQVWLESANPNGMAMMVGGLGAERPVVTGPDGIALLSPKEPGMYTLIARAGNNAPQVRKEVEIHSGETALSIEVLGAEVTGSLFANSKPVPGASLTLASYQDPDEEGGEQTMVMSFVVVSADNDGGGAMSMDTGNPNDATAVSDSDGEFRFTDVPSGTWVVRSRARGFESWESDPFTVGEGVDVNIGAHQLMPGASVSGFNLAADTNRRGGMFSMDDMLRLQDENGEGVEMGMGNPDGSYSFKDLPAGKYKIVRGDYESEVFELSPGEQMTLDLPKE